MLASSPDAVGGGGMDVERLKRLPLFDDLSRTELKRIATWTDEIDVPEGTRLIAEGDFPHEFLVIEEGTAEVTLDGRHLRDLGPGDFFGEIALLEGQRRTASVAATSSLRGVVMFAREFKTLASEMPAVAERIRSAMRSRQAASPGSRAEPTW
jgi:CRP-like cAMP-binding protein